MLGNGRIAPVLQMLTMEASGAARRCSSVARMPRNAPRQLTRHEFSNPSAVSSVNDARCSTPAQLTSVLSDPKRSTTAATAESHCRSAVTSKLHRDQFLVARFAHRGGEIVGPPIAGRHRKPLGA